MKVYSISRWAFWGICLLIVALPVSRHWKLLSTGERVKGTVADYVLQAKETKFGDKVLQYANVVRFRVADTACFTFGPADIEYDQGKIVPVVYDPDDPEHNIVATFAGFYLDSYTTLPIILLVVWTAFYSSFNNYRKKQRVKSGKLASSPYGPVRKPRHKKLG